MLARQREVPKPSSVRIILVVWRLGYGLTAVDASTGIIDDFVRLVAGKAYYP